MATEIGFTQENLDALEQAIAQGVKTVQYTDKVITYRDLNEMLKIRDLIRIKLGLTEARNFRRLSQTDKGL